MRNITIVVVLACAVWAVRAARRPPPAYTMIEGRVYEALDPVRGPMRPIAGAAVSNNWDDATTKTDADGRFALRVRRVAADEFLSLRAQIGDKAACRRLAGGGAGHRIDLFADGGPFRSYTCQDTRPVREF
jgi:hypothetical protein